MNVEQELARSLGAETTDVIPFISYLLQDYWSLAVNPLMVLTLAERNLAGRSDVRVLDLACGKGAISVLLARRLGFHITGVDIIKDFVISASVKAHEHKVSSLCQFIEGDAHKAVERTGDYDCVIFSGVGPALGDMRETLRKLKNTVKNGGGIILDNYDYLDKEQSQTLFKQAGLECVDEINEAQVGETDWGDYGLIKDSASGLRAIARRVGELSDRFPALRSMFEQYLESQRQEYIQIENQCPATKVIWFLRKL